MVWILHRVNNFSKTLRKCAFFHTGIIVLLLMIDLRSARTNEKQTYPNVQGINQYDPYKEIHLERELNLGNRSESIRQNDWKPIPHNTTSDRRMYLTKVNVFESQKITNKSDLVQNMTRNKQDKMLPNLFRTLRLANAGRDYDSFADDDDNYLRQKKRYRHSKRVRIIKPPHFLLPPKNNEQSGGGFENEAKQFYRVYQTKYMRAPGYKSSEENNESSWKTENDKDAIKRNPRIKKVRRRPTNYLRPPVITLTTTEHIFFIKPKETTPMSYIENNNYPPNNEDDMVRTTERTSHNVTRSLDENDITLKPLKYRVIPPTTTEINYINRTTPDSVHNTSISSDSYYSDLTPRTYNFANSPVTVYSMNDIFGLGGLSTSDWRGQHKINAFNDSKTVELMMANNSSERNGRRYYDNGLSTKSINSPSIQTSFETGGVYAIDPPNFSRDKEALWPTYRSPTSTDYRGPETSTSYRQPETIGTTRNYNILETTTSYKNPETSASYGGSGTTTEYRNPGTATTSAYIYSDEVLKSSSYIPDEVSGFYVTNGYRTTGENKLSTLSGIQSGILIQEINAMMPNSSTSVNRNQEEVSAHTESYFESTKMTTNNLMSPDVQKSGMSVSKLELNPVENKSDGLHKWISRFNPDVKSFKSNGQNFGGGLDDSFDYQDLHLKHPSDRQVKLHVAESGHFRKGQSVEKGLLLQQNNVIPGEAGSDYPILSRPPLNSRFMCKTDGLRYVADVSSGCQVFYMCVGEGPGEPMLCPNGTLFSQDFLVCDWWYNVECRYK